MTAFLGKTPSKRQLALLSLLKACTLLSLVFTQEERKAASMKVDRLVKGELFGDSVAKVLEEIEMAATSAALAAVTAAERVPPGILPLIYRFPAL